MTASPRSAVRSRANAILSLAGQVESQRIRLGFAANVEREIDALRAVPGIGAWTAQYVAMRALQWPDAFPSGDLVLRRNSGLDERALQSRAEAWRPWRAYAAHYLWQSAGAHP